MSFGLGAVPAAGAPWCGVLRTDAAVVVTSAGGDSNPDAAPWWGLRIRCQAHQQAECERHQRAADTTPDYAKGAATTPRVLWGQPCRRS
ncbi:hypothetical protein FM125_02340 [Micrococcus lylae]|uniref:Uncharacterized protein n=1 Tax=Micrococcus lylae TaxID=1273 RepID=A0A1R4IGJ4_9MICC|nr:hypothetical protein FM125_02340 [Micrococcus lylae]